MRFEYYPETDILYIELMESDNFSTKKLSNGVTLDFNKNGHLTGIEVSNAKQVVNLSELETNSLPLQDLIYSTFSRR